MRLALLLLLVALCLPGAGSARVRHLESWTAPGPFHRILDIDVAGDGSVYVAAANGIFGHRLDIFRFSPTGESMLHQQFQHARETFGAAGLVAMPDGGVFLCTSGIDRVGIGMNAVFAEGEDLLLTRINADRSIAWINLFGNKPRQAGYATVLAPDGNLLVTGTCWGKVDLGGGELQAQGSGDVLLAKLRPDGTHVWSRLYGSTGVQEGHVIAVDDDGRIALAGRFEGIAGFGGALLRNGTDDDAFVAVLDAQLNHVLSVAITSLGSVFINAIAFDPGGNVVVAGSFSSDTNFGGEIRDTRTPAPFLASYNVGGLQSLWTREEDARFSGMIIGEDGAILTIGDYHGAVAIAPQQTAPGATLLVEFDSAPRPVSASGFGKEGGAYSHRLTRAEDGRILAAGVFTRSIDFGSGSLSPRTGQDLFLAWFEPWRPPQIRVATFQAETDDETIRLDWSIESDETGGAYRVRRREDGHGKLRIVTYGDAHSGAYSFVDTDVTPGRAYSYDVVVSNRFGDEVTSDPVSVTIPAPPGRIEQNVPNPFNPVTSIAYSLASHARVFIAIYDVDGALVRRLDQGARDVGRHTAYWNGYDAVGRPATSGVYFYRLEGAVTTPARRMVLLR
jgi:hypothetical protein